MVIWGIFYHVDNEAIFGQSARCHITRDPKFPSSLTAVHVCAWIYSYNYHLFKVITSSTRLLCSALLFSIVTLNSCSTTLLNMVENCEQYGKQNIVWTGFINFEQVIYLRRTTQLFNIPLYSFRHDNTRIVQPQIRLCSCSLTYTTK